MKHLSLALLAAAGLTAASAQAHGFDFRGFFNFGAPVYTAPAPTYCPPAAPMCPTAGYWRDVVVNVWVPGRWVTQYDDDGCATNVFQPGHYEARTQRVWVAGDQDDAWARHEWQEHEEHEQWEHRGWDDDD